MHPSISRERWLIPSAVLLISAAVFLPALGFGFVCDDNQQIVLNQGRFTWQALPSYFTTDVWSYLFLLKTNYYRPIFMVWMMLNYQLFGLNPALWHAGAILAHLAATLLVYLLALRLTANRWTAGAAAVLFGVHPVHSEAVAWISGATEPVFATLALGTLLCHARAADVVSSRRQLWRAAEWGLFALALFSKETAIVLPGIVCAWDLLLAEPAGARLKRRVRNALVSLVPYASIVLIYFAARFHALQSFAPLTRRWTWHMLLETWPSTLQFYLRQLLLPIQYSLFYPISPVTHLSASQVWIPSAIVAAAAALLIWICWRSPVRTLCTALLVLPILPVLNLRAFAFDDYLHDRYTYLPSAGLCILAAIGLHKIIARPAIRIGVLACVTAGLAGATVWSSRIWSDNLTLYTRAIEVAPDSTIVQEYLGQELLEQMRWADALPLLSKALVGDPNGYEGYIRIAKCYVGLGEPDQAAFYFRYAITMAPGQPDAYVDLATVEFNQTHLTEAESLMRQAMALRPAYSPLYSLYHYRLARILESQDRLQDAVTEYEAELAENPSSEDAQIGLDRAQRRLAKIK